MDQITFALFVTFGFMLVIFIIGLFLRPKAFSKIWTAYDQRILKKWLIKIGADTHGYKGGKHCIFNNKGHIVAQFIRLDDGTLYLEGGCAILPGRLYDKMNIKFLKLHLTTLPDPADI